MKRPMKFRLAAILAAMLVAAAGAGTTMTAMAAEVNPGISVMAVGSFFSTGGYTKKDIDSEFNTFILPDVNTNVRNYAIVGVVEGTSDTASKSTITITDANYNAQDACVEIVSGIMEKLYADAKGSQAIDKVTPTAADPGTCLDTCLGDPSTCLDSDGSIRFGTQSPSLSGDAAKDKATFIDFCNCLGIMRYSKLSDLDGKAFAFKVVPSKLSGPPSPPGQGSSPEVTYTFTFALPKMELKPAEEGKAKIDTEDKTLSGTDLVSTDKKSGKKASEVKGMFQDVATNLNAEIKVFDKDNKEVTDLSSTVGTGYRVELVAKNGSVLDYVTVIVTGDTSGDGTIDHNDAQRILDDLANIKALDGVYKTAGLMGEKTELDNVDAQKILDIAANVTAKQ